MKDKEILEPGNVEYVPYKTRIKSPDSGKFSEQEIRLEDTPLYFIDGLEKLFALLYFIALPYIAGLLFLFIYVAEANFELFVKLDQSTSIILTWAIGYEILAGLLLLYIVKMSLSFFKELGQKGKKRKFQIP